MSEQPRPGDRRPHVPFPFEARQWLSDAARVVCVDGRDSSDVVHEGVVIGFTEAPTVRVQKDDGQIVTWVLGLTRPAQSYLDELPEWEQELLVQEDARRSSVDPHKPEVLIQARTGPLGWEPKVWHSDGPEPAEHVKVLRYLDGKPDDRWPFVVRRESGWLWATSPDDPVAGEVGAPWAVATGGCPGRYREVQR